MSERKMNTRWLPAVEGGVRMILAVVWVAAGLSFASPPPPIPDPGLTLCAAGSGDGGKKRKDEEKEEDYARRLSPGGSSACC